jgi:uncharacterized phage-associated protein
MYNINDIADYIILKLKVEDEGSFFNNLKLQKLLYYVQAWYLAFYNKPIFDAKFQAWVHGPVCKIIFDRFKNTKSIYSEITINDIINKDAINILAEEDRKHIDLIIEHYGHFSGTDLEYISHQEEPWISARKGFSPIERCEVEIDEDLMGSYYKKRLS